MSGEIEFAPNIARFVSEDIETFAAVDEPGADPLVITGDGCAIPVGGLVKVYGTGGATKTTLVNDWAVTWASGRSWHALLTPRERLRILIVENEGPRAEFRRKLRKRLAVHPGPELTEFLHVLREPWATVDLRDEYHRAQLARLVVELEIDLVIIGPLATVGMEGGGTAEEIKAFVELLARIRKRAERPLTFLIVHHENRAGQISGAWEPWPDLLVHVQTQGHGRTRVFWQKARHASDLHQTTTHLLWRDGETFDVEEREEVSEETIANALLDAARELPGGSWTKIRERVKGRGELVMDVRDRLLADGVLINGAAREGWFNLWAADDPAALRSTAGTAWERRSSASPEEGAEAEPFPVPTVGEERVWERNGSGEPEANSVAEPDVDEIERLATEVRKAQA